MQAQDTVVTQDVLPVNRLTDLEEFAQQHSDNRRAAEISNRMDEGKVSGICLRSHTDFFVEPSQSDQIAYPQQDSFSNPRKATAQPEHPRSALLNQMQSGVASRFDAECLMVGHWECQICGARYLGPLPTTCEACGADRRSLEHPQVIRLEMTCR